MPNRILIKKSPELLQAQAAGFAESHGQDESQRFVYYRKIGTIGIRSGDTISKTEVDAYKQYLRGRSEADRSAAQEEAELLTKYDEYVGSFDIDEAVEIGRGNHSSVYRFEKDSVQYVARIVSGEGMMPQRVVHNHVAAYARASDIPGLEKIVAASYEKGIVISEYVDAQKITDLTPDQIMSISDDHFNMLLATREASMQRGVAFDAHYDNLLYDAHVGFTDIDYSLAVDKINPYSAIISLFSSLDLTEYELYEKDPNVKHKKSELKIALRDRVIKYINDVYGEEVSNFRGDLAFVIARRIAGNQLNLAK